MSSINELEQKNGAAQALALPPISAHTPMMQQRATQEKYWISAKSYAAAYAKAYLLERFGGRLPNHQTTAVVAR